MGIFDMFTSNNQQPTQGQQVPAPNEGQPMSAEQQAATQQQQGQPGNLPANAPEAPTANQVTAPNGVVPPESSVPKTPDSPLDKFATLWDTVPDAGTTEPPAPLDPAKLQEVISKANLASSISPENMAAITAGGEEAQKALMESLNTVAQQTLLQATLASDKMTKQAVDSAVAAMEAKIPEMLRAQATTTNLQEANPVFSSPAVKPVIEAVQAQLAAKNPSATPAQLTEMAQDFVSVMGEALAPKQAVSTDQNAEQDVDWGAFLNMPQQN